MNLMARQIDTESRASASAATLPSGAMPALVRTIDLSNVRVHLGARFPTIVEQLHLRLRQDIPQLVGANGWICPIGNLFYMIVLWGMNEDSATGLVQRFLKRIHAHLRDMQVETAGLFIPVNAAHLDRRGRPRIDAIQSLEEGDGIVEPSLGDATALLAATPEDRSSFAFEPVWNVRQGVVSAFRCIRMEPIAPAMTNGEVAVAERVETSRIAGSDLGVLRHAIAEWSRLPADAVCLLIVPVHFDTLAGAGSRRDFLQACGAIPAALKRLLIFEIERIPEGVLSGRLLEVARHMKPFCRSVTALVPFDCQSFDAIQRAGIPIVACNAGGTRSEHQCLPLMERFVERAEKLKLLTGIYGIRSVSLTTAALAAGFVYIGGEAVSSLAETPRGLFKFEMADVYRSELDT